MRDLTALYRTDYTCKCGKQVQKDWIGGEKYFYCPRCVWWNQ